MVFSWDNEIKILKYRQVKVKKKITLRISFIYTFSVKMPISLASRALIVQKMDRQFNDDLRMRKDTTILTKDRIDW